jgi:osmoprotectant transport system permease protein
VFAALTAGELDAYPEYTGTIRKEIFAGEQLGDAQLREALAARGVGISEPLGFENTYALAMRREQAERLGIERISDLARHDALVLGFSHEFLERADGWPQVRQRYGLPQREVLGMEQELAYRQLDSGAIDVMDAYSTDAKLRQYDLVVLEDDRGCFPEYAAVLLYRLELAEEQPEALGAFAQLEGALDAPGMTRLNAEVEISGRTEREVAADFLAELLAAANDAAGERTAGQSGSLPAPDAGPTRGERIWQRTAEHLDLVRKSLIPAILLAIPLGVLASKLPSLGHVVLIAVSVVQTIPALALLVLLMPPVQWLGWASVGVGSLTAIVALWLYSLLPIVRATHAAVHSIDPELRESALALGLPAKQRLLQIELPLATSGIMAGIKTAAVLNVGFATLGALVGAGGYGQPILRGIRLNQLDLLLEGAVPAALMALLVQGAFGLWERRAPLSTHQK